MQLLVPFSVALWELPRARDEHVRYYVPKLVLAVLLPEQVMLEDKFGGLPWGLPPERWPYCQDCGKPQTLIAELQHHAVRLDLGREGRVLFVFQCDHNPGGCRTWVGDSGANACFVLEPEELTTGLLDTPTWETTIEVEARVMDWEERDDGVPDALMPAFLSDAGQRELDDATLARVHGGTKLGGAPAWLQSADEAPSAPYTFALQMDSCHELTGTVPPAELLGSIVHRQVDGRVVHEEPLIKKRGAPPWVAVREGSWICDAANFGDMGRAYVFIRRDRERPEGWFFWQC